MKKILFFFLIILATACMEETGQPVHADYTTFQSDIDFMRQYTEILVLEAPSGKGQIALSAALQGRVMTSTADGSLGRSYGWINRELFASGDTLAHINPYGGEERFWLGPEGGQYSIFFEAGKEFTLEDWQTPRLIDLDPFELKNKTKNSAVFTKRASLKNYSGYMFNLDINRKIEMLSGEELFNSLGLEASESIKAVAYKSTNTLTNTGEKAWSKENGLLSIWLLGMFNHSPSTVVIIPFRQGEESELGPVVNDSYFGKVPAKRLGVYEDASVVFFSGDGQYRSKIGLSPSRARNVLGSFDEASNTLTICTYNQPEGILDYVNSLWEIQEEPYRGDVINSYNDGPPSPGAKPLGPFYELETSSPALALKSGESGVHVQTTYHFEGAEEELTRISETVLGVTIEEIQDYFNYLNELSQTNEDADGG